MRLNNACNVGRESDARAQEHIFSATGALSNMDDAFYAAELIPNDMSVHEAECEFIGFVCENLREAWLTHFLRSQILYGINHQEFAENYYLQDAARIPVRGMEQVLYPIW